MKESGIVTRVITLLFPSEDVVGSDCAYCRRLGRSHSTTTITSSGKLTTTEPMTSISQESNLLHISEVTPKKRNTTIGFRLGRLKFRLERMRGYASWLSAIMIAHMWMKQNDVSPWIVGLVVCILLLMVWIDKKWIWPGEYDAWFKEHDKT